MALRREQLTAEQERNRKALEASRDRAKVLASDAGSRERLTRKRKPAAPTTEAEFRKKYA